jgi:hypothetical protein
MKKARSKDSGFRAGGASGAGVRCCTAAFLLGLVLAFFLGPWPEPRLREILELLAEVHKGS